VLTVFYVLFLAGAFAGCGTRIMMMLDTRRAGQPRPGSHEDLP